MISAQVRPPNGDREGAYLPAKGNRQIPFSTPVALTTDRVVLASTGWGTALVAACLVLVDCRYSEGEPLGPIDPSFFEWLGIVAFIGLTTLIGHLVVRTVLRAPDLRTAHLASTLLAVGGGIANGFAFDGTLFVAIAFEKRWQGGETLWESAVCLAVAAVIGAVTGFLFGLAYQPLALYGHRLRQLPAHDSADRGMIAAGAWLVFVGGVGAMIGIAGALKVPGVRYAPALTAAVGLLVSAIGAVRITARNRWLRRVAANGVEGFTLMPYAQLEPQVVRDLEANPRRIWSWSDRLAKAGMTKKVLVRHGNSSAYRGGGLDEPLAILLSRDELVSHGSD